MLTLSSKVRSALLLFVSVISLCVFTPSARANSSALDSAAAADGRVPFDVMRAEFENAPNYAAFIHEAMQRPAEGGRFYALLAYHRCAELDTVDLKVTPKAGAPSDVRDRAVKKVGGLKMRCGGVKQQFPDELTLMGAIKAANARGTPDALLIEESAFSSGNGESSSAHLQRAMTSGDRYLIAATMDMSVEDLAGGIDVAYEGGENRPALFMAASAAACEVIGNCRDNVRLLIVCVSGGTCAFDDLRDFLRAGLPPASRPLFDKTRRALLQRVDRQSVAH